MSRVQSKYRAQPKFVDGIRFHSQREAARYLDLKLLEKAGEIHGLVCQLSFDLFVDDYSVGGKLKRAAAKISGKPNPHPVKIGRYVADFSYWTKDDKRVVEDVKGFKTPLYRWKKKHVEAQYGLEITEVR
jgi:hypothetical protein